MSSFEESYSSLSGVVFRFIAKRTNASPEVVEDLASQTMISAWKGWNTFQKKSSYVTWICRIALNKIADYYRQKFNSSSTFIAPFIESLIEPQQPNFEENLALEDLKSTVASWLNLVSVENRHLLYLKYWDEASNAEIGKVLGISTKSVECRLYRARRALASAVAKEGPSRV